MAEAVHSAVTSRGSITTRLNHAPGAQPGDATQMLNFVAGVNNYNNHHVNGQKAFAAKSVEPDNSLNLEVFWVNTPINIPSMSPDNRFFKVDCDFVSAAGATVHTVFIKGCSQKQLVHRTFAGNGSGTAATMTVRGVAGGMIVHCLAALGTQDLAGAQIGASQTSLTAGTIVQNSLSIMSICSVINNTEPIEYTLQVTSMSATAKFTQLAVVINPYDGTM